LPDNGSFPLGVAALPAPFATKMEQQDGEEPVPVLEESTEGAEALQQYETTLREYYAALNEAFPARVPSLQEELSKAEEMRAASKEIRGDPPADGGGGEAGAGADVDPQAPSPEEVKAQEQRRALDEKIQELKDHLGKCNAAIEKISEKAVDKEHDIVTGLPRLMLAIEQIASRLNARWINRTGQQIESNQRALKFDPPERQEDADDTAEGACAQPAGAEPHVVSEEVTQAAPVAAIAPPLSFMPLPFGTVGPGLHAFESEYFPELVAALCAAVPAPLVPEEAPLPPPYTISLVSRPPGRPPRLASEYFSLITKPPPSSLPEAGDEDQDPQAAAAAAAALAKGNSKGKPVSPTPGSASGESPEVSETRWIIEPQGEQRVYLNFFSETIGTFDSRLAFEVVGGINGNAPISIAAVGTTAYPSINSDPRNVFMRRAKAKPASGYAHKQYISSLNVYDFGPLLAGRDRNSYQLPEPVEGEPRAELDPNVRQHIENFRITNNSLFKAQVRLQLGSADATVVDDDKKKAAAAATTDNFETYPFIVEPTEFELEIDETMEVRVCCFPVREGIYNDTLVAHIEHNPDPVEFRICAIGSVPKVNLDTNEVNFDRFTPESKGYKLSETLQRLCCAGALEAAVGRWRYRAHAVCHRGNGGHDCSRRREKHWHHLPRDRAQYVPVCNEAFHR